MRFTGREHLQVAVRSPLPPVADPRFDAIADLTRRVLHVPSAFMSLFDADRQVLPGAFGLHDALQDGRVTQLSESFCQFVVRSGSPLIVADAREVDFIIEHPAFREIEVVAYAGVPIVDADGVVVGSLCAMDNTPRSWTDNDVALLTDLAAFCAAELRLRAEAARTAVAADRDRIASDLQTGVVRDLFSLSLLLGGVRSLTAGDAATMTDDAIDAVDQILARMRTVVLNPILEPDEPSDP